MINLAFTSSAAPMFVRGKFFRICSDGTLRGPESNVIARYSALGWLLAGRNCREFEATGPLFLRAYFADGRRVQLGPYPAVRAADGALFDRARCLGTFCINRAASPGIPEWKEVTILGDAEGRRVPMGS